MRALGLGLAMNKLGSPRFRGLLDKFGGAVRAWSLGNLTSEWVGQDVIIGERTTSPAERGFTAGEVTDGTLETWSLGGDVFAEFVDQSGGSFDATQSLVGLKPKIVDAGVLITNKPTIKLYGICGQSNSGGYAPVAEAGTRFDAVSALPYNAKIYNKDLTAGSRAVGFQFAGNQHKTNVGAGSTVFGPESECINLGASASEYGCIVKFSSASTDLWEEWDSEQNNLYPIFIADYKDAVAELEGLGFIVQHMGVMYGQGEKDAKFDLSGSGPASYYQTKQQALVDNMRIDLGLPNLPIMLTTISHGVSQTYDYEADVNTAKTNVAAATAGVSLIDSSAYTFNVDDIHYDGASQILQGAALYAGAVGTETTGVGTPAVDFDGVDDILGFTALAVDDFYAVSSINCPLASLSASQKVIGETAGGSINFVTLANATTGSFRAAAGSAGSPSLDTTIIPDTQTIYSFNRVSDSCRFYANGITRELDFVRAGIFAGSAIGGSSQLASKLSTLVVYDSDQTANRAAIESIVSNL